MLSRFLGLNGEGWRAVAASGFLNPIQLWMSLTATGVIWYGRAHPVLAIMLVAPLYRLGQDLLLDLHPAAKRHTPFSRSWFANLAALVVALLVAGFPLWALYGFPGSIGNEWWHSGFWLLLVALFVLSFVYRITADTLRRFFNASGLTDRRLWQPLGSVVILWLWVDGVFAGAYQWAWVACANPQAPGWCNAGQAFSRNVGSFVDAFYFSTTTLATVGYGDITPSVPATRIAVTVEILLGVGLLAFLLGRVVSYKPTRETPSRSVDLRPPG